MVRKIFGTADRPRFILHRQAHRLRPVELRILEGCQPDQAIRQRLRKPSLIEVEEVGQRQRQ